MNAELCIDCGLCIKKCSFIKKDDIRSKEVDRVWAYRIVDKNVLFDSTSGGAFTGISDVVLECGGSVSACIMDESFTVRHILTTDKITRDEMRRSKYVQSSTAGIFAQVKTELKKGKTVLFVGTPCQVAQMIEVSDGHRDNLIACDFICHGVPNNDFFINHIHFLEGLYGKKAIKYFFRGKRYGWNHLLEEVKFANGRICGDKKVQAYSKFFYSGVSLRPSCYNCRYRSIDRVSDITIADFWGIDKIIGDTDNLGYSLIAVNTEKGKQIVELLSNSGKLIEVEKEKVVDRIGEPILKCKIDTDEFWKLYQNEGYSGLVNRYTDVSFMGAVVHKIKKLVKRIIK